jgi:hypothetical protein
VQDCAASRYGGHKDLNEFLMSLPPQGARSQTHILL